MERNTRQRGAIRRAFQRAERPLSTTEVLEGARSEVAGLGIATVYRNIRTLLDEAWLRTIALPGVAPRYEIEGKPHHHYFHCRGCDRCFDVEGCVANLPLPTPPGFTLEAHEIVLYGRCADCSIAP